MADVNKSKLQVRSGLSLIGDQTPSPTTTRLLINHGKPNFTIQRSLRTQNGKVNPTSPTANVPCNMQNDNNDELVVKSTMFNGVFKPSNMSVAAKQTLTKNGNVTINNDTENEATKVVLRRPKFMQTEIRGQDGENVPEFIRRQRRIQERLANQNILDFENRRSGYFTQVLISPSSPNRQSFAETMSSPAVKPGLELPSPTTQHEGTTAKEPKHEEQQPEVENNNETLLAQSVTPLNGQVEEEEVAKAIEEVNKAVEGEDDDKIELEHAKNSQQESEQNIESTVVAVNIIQSVEETQSKDEEKQQRTVTLETPSLEDNSIGGVIVEVTSAAEITEQQIQQPNGQAEAEFTLTSAPVIEENIERSSESNNLADQYNRYGHLIEKIVNSGITISHTNDVNNCIQSTSDPKTENSTNFEPKTVVSFSQELGNGNNKYPDTVKVMQDVGSSEVNSSLQELTKLKFEIKANDQDIEVNPIIITTETV